MNSKQSSDPRSLIPDHWNKLKARINALRAKTMENGCTEEEALSAAAKVAELLDRHQLELSEIEIASERCERLEFASSRKKRVPLDGCIDAVAEFCDCRVWREKDAEGGSRFVFFGLRADIAAAHCLTDLIDTAIRTELGRYKTSADYQRFRHNERPLANSSFTFGMVASLAEKLHAMKLRREAANRGRGRDLVPVKHSMLDEELAKLDLDIRTVAGPRRLISVDAYEAGTAAGTELALEPGPTKDIVRRNG